MNVIDVVLGLSWNHYSVVDCGIDGYQNIVLGHNPLTRAVDEFHFFIYSDYDISAWVEVIEPRTDSLDVLSESLVESNVSLLDFYVGVGHTHWEVHGPQTTTNLAQIIEVSLVGIS
jgi:hypothetical protein